LAVPEGAIYSAGYKLWGVGTTEEERCVGKWRWYSEDGALVFMRSHREGGRPETDTHYYRETGEVYVEMNYDERGRGTPTVYIDPANDWQSRLSNFVNRRAKTIPRTARKVTKVPGAYPLTFQAWNAAGDLLAPAGVPYDKKTVSAVKKALKAKVAHEELPERLQAFREVLNTLSAQHPEAKDDLASLLDKEPKDLTAYKAFRKQSIRSFGETF
jgi:hypothetical protein